MKRVWLLLAILAGSVSYCMAGGKNKNQKPESWENDSTAIHWLTMDELQVAMKAKPKKVYMDVYTDWCGWCKRMDATTFSNKQLIKYMNRNFYAVKFNAERTDSVRFMGKMYGFSPQHNAHEIVVEIGQGQVRGYPTSIFMLENFQQPNVISSYLDVPTMEKILRYLAENRNKTQPFPEYEKTFVPTWK